MNLKQEKSNEELQKYANKIIALLGNSDLNIAEKYKIISSLHTGLIETIKELGGTIVVNDTK